MPWNQKYLEELSNEKENNSSIYMNDKNSQEMDIIELCKALKCLSEEIEVFFEDNKLHKLYCENSTFYDIAIDNDRFCKFCLFRKVHKNFFNICDLIYIFFEKCFILFYFIFF